MYHCGSYEWSFHRSQRRSSQNTLNDTVYRDREAPRSCGLPRKFLYFCDTTEDDDEKAFANSPTVHRRIGRLRRFVDDYTPLDRKEN